jgi:hypothetical protein
MLVIYLVEMKPSFEIYLRLSKTVIAGTIELMRRPNLVGENHIPDALTHPYVSGKWVLMVPTGEFETGMGLSPHNPIEITPQFIDSKELYHQTGAALVVNINDLFKPEANEIDFDYTEKRRNLVEAIVQAGMNNGFINVGDMLKEMDHAIFRWHANDLERLKSLTANGIMGGSYNNHSDERSLVIHVQWVA